MSETTEPEAAADREAFPGGARTRREIPDEPGLLAEAAANPGGYVYEIDSDVAGPTPTYVPPEAVAGAWVVGPDGKLTGDYLANPDAGPVRDDLSRLTEFGDGLEWLSDDPAAQIRAGLAQMILEQAPDAAVEWVKVTDRPQFAGAGRRLEEREDLVVLDRAAVAVPFALGVAAPDRGRLVVWGTFTWAAAGLDPDDPAPRRDRMWLDVWKGAAEVESLVQGRIDEVDQG